MSQGLNADESYQRGNAAWEADDVDSARTWWRSSAALGNAEAMFKLGALAVGDGDLRTAQNWYQQAAEHGHGKAMRNVGLMAQQRGDRATARNWYRRAADLGITDAMNDLGVLAAEDGDLEMARAWYQRATTLGNSTGQWNLFNAQTTLKSEVDLMEVIYPEFPAGWNSASDLMEGFLLAAALELRLRNQLSPGNPWAAGLTEHLPPRFRYDTLGQLLRFGPDGNRPHDGERIGRLPLLAIVWQFTDQALHETQHIRLDSPGHVGHDAALSKFNGLTLGKYGTALFKAAFHREWFSDDSSLSTVESAFVNGMTLELGSAGPTPGRRLHPDGSMYSDSIWQTGFRLVERRTPEFYIRNLQHRQTTVLEILDRGAALALAGKVFTWPGWPA